jgi:O-antigen/teichoic acid export membrane protein
VLGGAVLQMAFGFSVARLLSSKELLGLFSASIVAGNLIGALAGLGVDRLLVVLVAQTESREVHAQLYHAQTRLLVPRIALAAGGAFFWALLSGTGAVGGVLVLATATGSLAVQGRIDFAFAARRRTQGALMQLGYRGAVLILAGVIALCVVPDVRLTALALGLLGTLVVAGGIAHFTMLGGREVPAEPMSLRKMLKRARPYTLLPLAALTYIQGDILILALFRPLADVADYRVAYLIASSAVLGYHVVQIALRPRLASAAVRAADDEARFRVESERFHGAAFATVVVGIIIACFACRPFLELVLPRYAEAAPLAVILLGGYLLYYAPPYGDLFHVLERPGIVVRVALITGAVNVVLNLLLVPSMGAAGAAWATVLTFVALRAMYAWKVHQMRIAWATRRAQLVFVVLAFAAVAALAISFGW